MEKYTTGNDSKPDKADDIDDTEMRKYDLEYMLSLVTPDNCHPEYGLNPDQEEEW